MKINNIIIFIFYIDRKKKQNNTGEHGEDAEEGAQPNEDVTYASIDHSNAKTNTNIATTETECDYATVNIPRALLQEAESDGEDCPADDYVTMSWNMPALTQETLL